MKKTQVMTTKTNTFWYVILHGLLLFLSLGGIVSKFAAGQRFMSLPFILLYAVEIFILFVYAILWQQVLKHMSLTVAFSNKAVGMIWTMLWGAVIFKEQLTLQMILGSAIVLIGVLLVVKSDE